MSTITLPAKHLPILPDLPWQDLLHDDIEFYAEFYLTILMYLGYDDPDRLPKRRDPINPQDATSGTDGVIPDRRIKEFIDVLAAITVDKPGGNVYAVGLIYTAETPPKIIVGGNTHVEDKVEKLFCDVWAKLKDISSCYSKAEAGVPQALDQESPPRKLKGKTAARILKKNLEELLEILVIYSQKKIQSRFEKYVTMFYEVTTFVDKIGWNNSHVRRMMDLLKDMATKIAYNESGDALDTGLLLQRTLKEIAGIANELGAGTARTADQNLEYLVTLAEAEFASLGKDRLESPAFMKHFNIHRIMKKSFVVINSWNTLHRVVTSTRMYNTILSREVDIIKLQPQQRAFPDPVTSKHIELLIAKALDKSGEDEQYVEEVLRSDRVLQLYQKMGLRAPHHAHLAERPDREAPNASETSLPLGTAAHSVKVVLHGVERSPLKVDAVPGPLNAMETPIVDNRSPQRLGTSSASHEAASTVADSTSSLEAPVTGEQCAGAVDESEAEEKKEGEQEETEQDQTTPRRKTHENETMRGACKIIALNESQDNPEAGELVREANEYVASWGGGERSVRGYMQHAQKWVAKYNKNRSSEKMARELKAAYKNFAARERITATSSKAAKPINLQAGLKGKAIADRAASSENGKKDAVKEEVPGYVAVVHYECLVLQKLREMTLDESTPRPYHYIGVSKLCCFYCGSFYEFYNKYMSDAKVRIKGCHQKVYDRITAPTLGPELDRKINTQLTERFRNEIVKQLGMSGDEKVRSLSESSAEEDWGKYSLISEELIDEEVIRGR